MIVISLATLNHETLTVEKKTKNYLTGFTWQILGFFVPKKSKKRTAPLNLFGGFLNVTSLKVKPFLAGETSYQIDFGRIDQIMPVKNSDFQKLNSICWCFLDAHPISFKMHLLKAYRAIFVCKKLK